MTENSPMKSDVSTPAKKYMRYLLTMAGLGGLLYGVDVGVIAAALPYIEETSNFGPSQLSQVVAAVLFGSVLSSLFAGFLADKWGRRALIIIAAALFTISIPVICFSMGNFGIMLFGRILQGASAGIVGVVVPLYLAECLSADRRGEGTGMFQFLLTIGLFFAAVVGLLASQYVAGVKESSDMTPESLRSAQMIAWQSIFWVCAIPGLFLFFGAFRLSESPRHLFRKGRKDEAMAVLIRSYGEEEAKTVYDEMVETEAEDKRKAEALKAQNSSGESILQRKYVYPFILAVLVLAFTQATGINSVLNYSVKVFQQGGLEGTTANIADMAIKLVNCLMTIVAVKLVDKKGRKFLLKIGTAGIVVGLMGTGFLFNKVEKERVDITPAITQLLAEQASSVKEQFASGTAVKDIADLSVKLEKSNATVASLVPAALKDVAPQNLQLIVTYDQPVKNPAWYQFLLGSSTKLAVTDFSTVKKHKDAADTIEVNTLKIPAEVDTTNPVLKDEKPLVVDGNEVLNLKDVSILKAEIGQKPSETIGWGIMLCFIIFIAFYATGPGVCVWLALSELMPTRIRSNGMAIALLINQLVSTIIAGSFLPWVGSCGYHGVFFTLGGFTVCYFLVVTFLLPETKGRTLEEIEEYFSNGKMPDEKKEA